MKGEYFRLQCWVTLVCRLFIIFFFYFTLGQKHEWERAAGCVSVCMSLQTLVSVTHTHAHTHKHFRFWPKCLSITHTHTHTAAISEPSLEAIRIYLAFIYTSLKSNHPSHTQQPPAAITVCVCLFVCVHSRWHCLHTGKFVMIYSKYGMARECVCVWVCLYLFFPSSSAVPRAMMLTTAAQVVFFNNLIQQHNYQVSNCSVSISGPGRSDGDALFPQATFIS